MGRKAAKETEVMAYYFLSFRIGVRCSRDQPDGAYCRITHLHDEILTVTGTIAILLMFVHASWAIWTYVKGSAEAKRHFNRFSIVVWCIWLIPYLIGMAVGMHLHA